MVSLAEIRVLRGETSSARKAGTEGGLIFAPCSYSSVLSALCFPQHLVIVLFTLLSWNSGFCQVYFLLTLQDHFGFMRQFLLFLQDHFGSPGQLFCLLYMLCLLCRFYSFTAEVIFYTICAVLP